MIRPTPANATGRILALVAAGVTDLDTVTATLMPRPRLDGVTVYPMWCRAYATWQAAHPGNVAAVSRHVGHLREAGLLCPAKGPPTVADDVPDPLTAEWLAARFRGLADVPEEGEYDPASGDTAGFDRMLSMVWRIEAGATTVAAAVGMSGQDWSDYAALCAAEVLVSPRALRVTEKGVELVESWRKV